MGAVLRSLLACSFCSLMRGERGGGRGAGGKVAGVGGEGPCLGVREGRGLAAGRARGPARGQRSRPAAATASPAPEQLTRWTGPAAGAALGSSPPCRRLPAASLASPLLFSSLV